MDMSALLPLFLRKNGGDNGKMDALFKLAQGEKPDVSTVMQMAMENNRKNAAAGFRPIVRVASYSILGKLCASLLYRA